MQHSDPLGEVPLQVVQKPLVVNHKDQAGVKSQTGVLKDLVPKTVHPATCVDNTAAVPVCVGRGGEGRGGEGRGGEGRGGEERGGEGRGGEEGRKGRGREGCSGSTFSQAL